MTLKRIGNQLKVTEDQRQQVVGGHRTSVERQKNNKNSHKYIYSVRSPGDKLKNTRLSSLRNNFNNFSAASITAACVIRGLKAQ